MSRIGKIPVKIPQGVKVKFEGNVFEATGKEGNLKKVLNTEGLVEIKIDAEQIVVDRLNDTPRARAVHGLIRSLIQNIVDGVTTGFSRILDIVGVGYKAELKGAVLTVHAGYSHPVFFDVPSGLKVTVDKQTRVTLKGVDKWLVGETAARIRKIRTPEPYKGKGIRYSDEIVKRKVGKAAAGSGG